jgi:DNA polymerase-3 subunit epsilon
LLALIIEDQAIKKYWPKHNRAQKQPIGRFGIYTYEDQNGLLRLCVKRVTNSYKPIRSFTSGHRARQWLFEFADRNNIHYKYCGLPFVEEPEIDQEEHNSLVQVAIQDQSHLYGSFLIKGVGRTNDEQSFLWIDDGQLCGIGYVHETAQVMNIEDLTDFMTRVQHTSTIESILNAYLDKTPDIEIITLREPTI